VLEGGGHTKFWLEKPEGNSLLERPKGSWKKNYKINFKELGWQHVN
jgi:hypothetical protein